MQQRQENTRQWGSIIYSGTPPTAVNENGMSILHVDKNTSVQESSQVNGVVTDDNNQDRITATSNESRDRSSQVNGTVRLKNAENFGHVLNRPSNPTPTHFSQDHNTRIENQQLPMQSPPRQSQPFGQPPPTHHPTQRGFLNSTQNQTSQPSLISQPHMTAQPPPMGRQPKNLNIPNQNPMNQNPVGPRPH